MQNLRRRPAAGFTLIELMIVVVVVALLAALAYPSYANAILRSRRPNAKTALLDLASREERYFSTNSVYSADLANQLGYGLAPVLVPNPAQDYYSMTVAIGANGASFAALAVPQGGQAADTCGTYTINNFGQKGNTGNTSASGDCWR